MKRINGNIDRYIRTKKYDPHDLFIHIKKVIENEGKRVNSLWVSQTNNHTEIGFDTRTSVVIFTLRVNTDGLMNFVRCKRRSIQRCHDFIGNRTQRRQECLLIARLCTTSAFQWGVKAHKKNEIRSFPVHRMMASYIISFRAGKRKEALVFFARKILSHVTEITRRTQSLFSDSWFHLPSPVSLHLIHSALFENTQKKSTDGQTNIRLVSKTHRNWRLVKTHKSRPMVTFFIS